MNLRYTLMPLLCATAVYAAAVPAKPGATRKVVQPDGTEITLRVIGDEHHHYYLTSDDKVVLGDENERYCYATLDSEGLVVSSGITAHDCSIRTSAETAIADKYSHLQLRQALLKTPSKLQQPSGEADLSQAAGYSERRQAPAQSGIGLYDYSRFPTKGEVKALVFLVEYSDVHFTTENPHEYFNDMINQPGFSVDGATGSCRDYYIENSMGQFLPQFDVYGPVRLANTRAYYGRNSSTEGSDVRPQYMMLHAAQLLDDEVDFSQYDTDGDGYVDNVFIYYAGEGEAQGGSTESVWPHSWEYTFSQRFDGVRFKRYACSSELKSASAPDGVGTFIHEFGHVLGLPDLYNTDNAYATYTPGAWSAMDEGCYNNDSRTPPAFSSFERNALSWMEDDLTEITSAASCSLEALHASNKAYVIGTPEPNEFFLFENRQKEGWDAYLPYHGMLIWHIDYNVSAWYNNTVNNNSSHQRVDLVEASSMGTSACPFPGIRLVRKFRYGGNPNFTTWNGDNLELDLSNIKETAGVITFDVAGGGDDPASITDITMGESSVQVDGRTISVSAEGSITVMDLAGRTIATGDGSLSCTVAASGLYIVRAGAGCCKVLVK